MELLVAAGLTSLVAAGVAAGIYQVMSSQNELTRKFDGSEFVANLARTMSDRAQCKSMLSGQVIPTQTDFTAISLKGYKGFATNPTDEVKPGYIVSGTAANPQVTVTDVSWKLKDTAALSKTFTMTNGGVAASYFKAPMQLRIGLQVYNNGKVESLPYRYLDYHVVALATNRAISDCDGTQSVADTCAMIGSKLKADGTCEVNVEGCVIRGSYVKSFCSPTGYTCRATISSPSKVHPETKDYTCPTGSSAFSSFNYTWVSEEKTGKKSDTNVTNTIQAYMCMSCQ